MIYTQCQITLEVSMGDTTQPTVRVLLVGSGMTLMIAA